MNNKIEYKTFEMNFATAWFNNRTQSWDYRYDPPTDEDALDYLPQNPAAEGMFKLLRDHFGKSTLEAMFEVLNASINDNG